MLPQRRPRDAGVGSGDDDAVDVTADATVGDREPELLAGAIVGAEIEPSGPQPADSQLFELMTGVEDSEDVSVEVLALILRCAGDLIDQLTGARLADAAGAEIFAGRLGAIDRHQRVTPSHPGPKLGIDDLPQNFQPAILDPATGLFNDLDGSLDQGKTLQETMAEIQAVVERNYLEGALRRSGGRVGDAARIAGINPRSMYNKMKQLGLDKADFKPGDPARPAG